MAFQERQLGQTRPANTSAASIYSPGANTTGVVKTILVANVTNLAAAFSIFIDDNGTTYDENTAIAWKVVVEGNKVIQFDGTYPMNDASGNIAVQTDSANYLTFTLMGAEIT